MSPLQYQQLRLQEARRLIFSEGLAAAGYRVGYESPSQFSREYSRLFGAPRAARPGAGAQHRLGERGSGRDGQSGSGGIPSSPRPTLRNRTRHDPSPAPAPACPVPSAAATDSESFARRYLAYVHAVGQHSERLWPGWRMADKAFLYSDGRSTWVADAEGRAQRTTAAGDSDPDLDLSYAFPRYRGRPAVLLQISAAHLRSNTGNSETLAAIGPHEAFHRYAQEDWPGLRKPGGYRGDLATLDPRPREYRYALFQSLLQALRTPGQRDSYLSDAQGWLRRWREAAPEESRLAAQVDLSEGTARYIEMAAARYRTDFAEDPQRYRQALREYALAFYDANEIGVGVDSEAYEIGALAGVLLDLRDDDADWKEAATAGTWPLDYLLRDQPPAWSELPDDAGARRALPARDGRHPPAPGRVAGGLADPRRPLLVIPQPRRTIGFATAASEVRGASTSLPTGRSARPTSARAGMSAS